MRVLYAIAPLRIGLLTGGLLAAVMLASLFIANRLPAFETSAALRNDICRATFGLVMLMPIFLFLAHPRRMFASALLAWSLFALAYDFAGMYFSNLFVSLGRTPFEVLILGLVFYGVVAAVSWVAWMVVGASHDPAVPAPRHIHTRPHQR
ncbi:MAG TPA: hypothetical protein VJN90_02170 [Candidatus Acidoferrales bacterium]|nr:hypothetical protein [Candidatus Acidoferrales bacterium]